MPFRHYLLALAVVFVWGTNFVVIKLGLNQFPPFLFAALRFAASSLPFLLFVRRPAVTWGRLAAFGLLLGVGQFGLMFLAMRADIAPGLASLLMQSQVLFTIVLAMLIYHERPRAVQGLALLLAASGFALIARHTADHASLTPFGLALVLGAALSWSAANLVARGAGRIDALGFMIWSSVFAVLPLCALSWFFDGRVAISAGLSGAGAVAWGAVIWQAIGNTLFGYSAWNWLLARHPTSTVAPLALLVPVFGMSASVLWLGEAMQGWKLLAAALVIGGLALNMILARRRVGV